MKWEIVPASLWICLRELVTKNLPCVPREWMSVMEDGDLSWFLLFLLKWRVWYFSMIKVLNVYARFHVYMYINMCMYILLIYLLLSYFPHFFVFVEVDISFIWFLSGKSLGLSLCELNNLLNIFISIG